MARSYSMDRTRINRAFSYLNGPSEMPNRRFDASYQIGGDGIGPTVNQWFPKRKLMRFKGAKTCPNVSSLR